MHRNVILLLFVAVFTNIKAQTIYPSGVTNVIARYNFSTAQSVVTSFT